jgi:excisionase family DNA binding protein
MVAQPDALTFTADELADALHLAPSTVRLWCQQGVVAATKRGRLWRIPRREYLRLVGEDAGAAHEARGGDGVQRARERALRDIRAMAVELLERCDAALGEG